MSERGASAAPGLPESPYQVRGRLYLGTKAYFQAFAPGGYDALLSALRPPLAGFMRQAFTSRGWYEVMVVPELVEHEARVMGLSIPRYLDRRAGFQAERDVSGLRRAVLRLVPAEHVIDRLARSMTSTFNFGVARIERLAPGHLQVRIAGVPQPLCAWLEHSLSVYGHAGLSAVGRAGAQLRSLPPLHLPHASTVELGVDIKW